MNPRKADVILWPGGNPTMWQGNLTGWQDCWKRWPKAEFVVGPATFQGDDLPWRTILRTARANIAGLFARDLKSYQSLCSLELPSSVRIGQGHDAAFHLKDSKWITGIREACSSEYVLASFRQDLESAVRLPEAKRPAGRGPFSSLFHHHEPVCQKGSYQMHVEMVREMTGTSQPVLEQDAPLMSFHSFVECVSRASQVHTDRLHCLIMALLLGKEVFAYPTAYAKLEGVYEHSIKPWAKVNFATPSSPMAPP